MNGEDDTIREALEHLRNEMTEMRMALQHLSAENRKEIEIGKLIHTDLRTMTERHERILAGNGSIGLEKRVDRIEQVELRRTWASRMLWAAVVSMWMTVAAAALIQFALK